MPSTITKILRHGRRVRGLPYAMASLNTSSSAFASLCLKDRMRAPEARQPATMELWLSSSLTIKSPRPTNAGTVVEFVP